MMSHKLIAKTYGVPINYRRSPIKYFNWDGQQVNAKGLPEHDILHEIAHYIMSPKKYKKYVNFYLGRGPDEDFTMYKNTMSKINPARPVERKGAQQEEELTCVLEFIFAALYQDIETIQLTMENRQYMYKSLTGLKWEAESPEFLKIVKKLQSKRLVDKNWIPVALKKNNLIKEKNIANLYKFKAMINTISKE
jgi:hypothetical protein